MTGPATQERLRDALHAAARTIPDTAAPPGLAADRTTRRRWLLPAMLTATAVTAAAFAIPYALNSRDAVDRTPGQVTVLSAVGAPRTGVPRFAISLQGDAGRAVVYDTKNGKRVATIEGKNYSWVAAARDQRTFFLNRFLGESGAGQIVQVVLSDSGRVVSKKVLPETVTGRYNYQGHAVSPDGKKLALAAERIYDKGGSSGSTGVSVLDLETGDLREWHADDVSIASSPVWSPDGRSIAFVYDDSEDEGNSYAYTGQVRVLDTTKSGGLVEASRALTPGETIRLPGFGQGTLTALSPGSDGDHIRANFLELKEGGSWARARALVEISLRDGSIRVVDRSLAAGQIDRVVADGSGKHLLAGDFESDDVPKGFGRYRDGKVDWLPGVELDDGHFTW